MTEPTANVQAILDAYAATDGTYLDPNGVHITSLDIHVDDDTGDTVGNAIVLTTPDNPSVDPVVIVNPPIILPDPNGEIDKDGMKFREDPLGAVAKVIRDFGGPGQ